MDRAAVIRAAKVGVRSVHVLCAGVATGAFLFHADPRHAWLAAAAVTGLALLAVHVYESPAYLAQVRGVFVLAKLALLLALPRPETLAAVMLASVAMSHAPGRVRHHLLVRHPAFRPSRSNG